MVMMTRWLCVLCVALVASGCGSIARVAYNNAPQLMGWYIDDYLDLTDQQRDTVRDQLERLHAWHRAQELPQVQRALEELVKRGDRGLTSNDAEWVYLAARGTYRRTLEAMVPEMATVLASLDASQIASLEKRFAKDNDKIKQDAARPEAERVKKRHKRLLEQAEEWVGPLTAAQITQLKTASDALPSIEKQWIADRVQRQQEVLKLARSKPPRDQMVAGLRRIMINPESWRDPQYAAQLKDRERAAFKMIGELAATLNAAQREHLKSKLQGYLEDVTLLAQSAPASGRAVGSALSQ